MRKYTVHFGMEPCGTATVTEQGLFYRIHCSCDLTGSVPFRIVVAAEKEADLGLCVPMDGGFGLNTSIPINRIGRGNLTFRAKPKHTKADNFVPITPEEPFGYISRLKDAYMVKRDGIIGVAFKKEDRSQAQPDSDQSP